MPWNWCRWLVFLLLWTACMENDVSMITQITFQIRFPPRGMPSLLISKWFHPSNKELINRGNNESWYLSMTILWYWCVILHGCFCFHPFKVFILFLTHICYHIFGCYWIKLPPFIFLVFFCPPLIGLSVMFTAKFHAVNTLKKN